MAYEYEKFVLSLLTSLAIKKENKAYYKISDEVEDVYVKAKLWDSVYDMTIDKAILSKVFDDEMYKLLHQTDKTDATIILEVVQLFLDRLESGE